MDFISCTRLAVAIFANAPDVPQLGLRQIVAFFHQPFCGPSRHGTPDPTLRLSGRPAGRLRPARAPTGPGQDRIGTAGRRAGPLTIRCCCGTCLASSELPDPCTAHSDARAGRSVPGPAHALGGFDARRGAAEGPPVFWMQGSTRFVLTFRVRGSFRALALLFTPSSALARTASGSSASSTA